MDAYGVPTKDRPKYFKFNVFGGWALAGMLIVEVIRCNLGRIKDLKDDRAFVDKVYKEAKKAAADEVRPQIEGMERLIEIYRDDLSRVSLRVDTLKKEL